MTSILMTKHLKENGPRLQEDRRIFSQAHRYRSCRSGSRRVRIRRDFSRLARSARAHLAASRPQGRSGRRRECHLQPRRPRSERLAGRHRWRRRAGTPPATRFSPQTHPRQWRFQGQELYHRDQNPHPRRFRAHRRTAGRAPRPRAHRRPQRASAPRDRTRRPRIHTRLRCAARFRLWIRRGYADPAQCDSRKTRRSTRFP